MTRPGQDDLDDEIRAHIEISVRERIESGEDPGEARLAAMREFGNLTLTRESMRDVWRPRWLGMAEALWQDVRIALRSLAHARALAATVAVTLALGIGANAAIFSVVRQVLLRPLVNRDEDRLIVLAPERLNAFVFSGFAGIALLIAVVGVAGVLAFTVSARRREFGVRLAIGSAPRHLLAHVLSEGVVIAGIGIVAGAAGVYAFGGVAASRLEHMQLPGVLATLGAAGVLMAAAVAASLMPAARAARVDVLQALRSE